MMKQLIIFFTMENEMLLEHESNKQNLTANGASGLNYIHTIGYYFHHDFQIFKFFLEKDSMGPQGCDLVVNQLGCELCGFKFKSQLRQKYWVILFHLSYLVDRVI